MENQILKPVVLAAATLLLAGVPSGCKKAPPPAPEEKAEVRKPLDPVTGHSAFNQMYRPIREWAPDAVPLTLTSGDIEGIKNEDGKAAMWTGVFVSPSRREARTVFFSATDHGSVVRGITLAGAQPWSGATPKSRPFDPTQFFVDSDQAYKSAVEKAGAWLKKHPDEKLSMYLASESRDDNPVWIVMWGDSKSGYVHYVSASSGKTMSNR